VIGTQASHMTITWFVLIVGVAGFLVVLSMGYGSGIGGEHGERCTLYHSFTLCAPNSQAWMPADAGAIIRGTEDNENDSSRGRPLLGRPRAWGTRTPR
jgi:hypothetical protein